MKRVLLCALVATAVAVLPLAASARKTAHDLKSLKALSELPEAVDEAVKAGGSEEEVGKTIRAMKKEKVKGEPALEMARHFRKQAKEGTSDKGLSDVVHGCLAQGKRGNDLVACVHQDWEKKPKVKKDGQGQHLGRDGTVGEGQGKAGQDGGPGPQHGKPEGAGRPDDRGQGEGQGQPEAKGQPDGKGQPEAKGQPDGKGQPEAKGQPDGKGQPEAKGQPGATSDKGKQQGKGGH